MSELRQDLVSGDWIIVAPERGGRPHDFIPKKSARPKTSVKTCPFENLRKTGNWPPILSYPNEKNWEVVIIPNKYPALKHLGGDGCVHHLDRGPFKLINGVGRHDLVVTREHDKNFTELSPGKALRVFQILQKRYRMLAADECLSYTSVFLNWGPNAGATIYHPHFQVVTLPIIPPDVSSSLNGSARYFKKHRKCVHCVMIDWEKKQKKRIVAENSSAVAVAPFVSREPFEVRIFPRRHRPYFEETSVGELKNAVLLLQSVLKRIKRRLNDPDYNFFIHTAPLKNRGDYRHYHWHIEIIPKIHISAGFELSTGVDINVVDPDQAARVLA